MRCGMSTWSARTESEQAHTDLTRIVEGERELRFGEVLDLLDRDPSFRAHLREELAGARFEAFFWETPPVTLESLDQPFEMALVDAPPLDARPKYYRHAPYAARR